MTKHNPAIAAATQRVFPSESLVAFAKGYPETPHVLRHALEADERFSLDALASLSEALPAKSIEYNRGDLPIGIDGKPGSNGLSIGETIRQIATSQSWAVLKNIEQVPEYQALLM
ncbi:MAG: transcriptional regulator, partial [Pseudomonadota bacterium]|nr:transcriptional regulator [Pseudomonadota bacterium]